MTARSVLLQLLLLLLLLLFCAPEVVQAAVQCSDTQQLGATVELKTNDDVADLAACGHTVLQSALTISSSVSSLASLLATPITFIQGHLIVTAPHLTNLTGLDSLQNLGSSLQVSSTSGLRTLHGLEALKSCVNLRLYGPELVRIDQLQSLESVGTGNAGEVIIYEGHMTNISLPALKSTRTAFRLIGQPQLGSHTRTIFFPKLELVNTYTDSMGISRFWNLETVYFPLLQFPASNNGLSVVFCHRLRSLGPAEFPNMGIPSWPRGSPDVSHNHLLCNLDLSMFQTARNTPFITQLNGLGCPSSLAAAGLPASVSAKMLLDPGGLPSISLASQAEVDAFGALNYTLVWATMDIAGPDIVSLAPLRTIRKVHTLNIKNCPSLEDISGLRNIADAQELQLIGPFEFVLENSNLFPGLVQLRGSMVNYNLKGGPSATYILPKLVWARGFFRLQILNFNRTHPIRLIALPQLLAVGSLYINDNPFLEQILCPKLATIFNGMSLTANDNLLFVNRTSFPALVRTTIIGNGVGRYSVDLYGNHRLCPESIDHALLALEGEEEEVNVRNGQGCPSRLPPGTVTRVCAAEDDDVVALNLQPHAEYVFLTNQAEVDAFGALNCTKLYGRGLYISGSLPTSSTPNITSLASLSHLREVAKIGVIDVACSSLVGLHNLAVVYNNAFVQQLHDTPVAVDGVIVRVGASLTEPIGHGLRSLTVVAGFLSRVAIVEPLPFPGVDLAQQPMRNVSLPRLVTCSTLYVYGAGDRSGPFQVIDMPSLSQGAISISRLHNLGSLSFPALVKSTHLRGTHLPLLSHVGRDQFPQSGFAFASGHLTDNQLLCTIDSTLFAPGGVLTFLRNGFGCATAFTFPVNLQADRTATVGGPVQALRVGVPTFIHPSLVRPINASLLPGYVLPPGLALDATTGDLYGTPLVSGNFTIDGIIITTTDGQRSARLDRPVTLHVLPPVQVLDTASTPVNVAVNGATVTAVRSNVTDVDVELHTTVTAAFSVTVEVRLGGGERPYRLQDWATDMLPAGFLRTELLPATAETDVHLFTISGTPRAATSTALVWQFAVLDANNASVTVRLAVAVEPGMAIFGGTLHATQNADHRLPIVELLGGAVFRGATAASGGAPYVIRTVDGTRIPQGMAVETTSGLGGETVVYLVGRPAHAAAADPAVAVSNGTSMVLQAEDMHGVALAFATVVVIAPELNVSVDLAASALPTATLNEEYRAMLSLTVAGGRAPHSFALLRTMADGTQQTLTGVEVDSSGQLGGTMLDSGELNLTLVVTDANGASAASQPFTVTSEVPVAENQTSSTISLGSVLGATIAGVVLLLLVAAAVLYARKHRHNKRMAEELARLNARVGKIFMAMSEDAVEAEVKFKDLEMDRSRLHLDTELGKGEFGTVHRARVQGGVECPDATALLPSGRGRWLGNRRSAAVRVTAEQSAGGRQSTSRNGGDDSGGLALPAKVAVKMLHSEASPDEQEKFLLEARFMAQLEHPHIVAVLGVCTQKLPFMLVMGLMATDLRKYLLGIPRHMRKATKAETLIKAAQDICSAMAYLESKHIIHRDLAARNVLVGASLDDIKLSDFGMSRMMDSHEAYYRKASADRVPVKWMAPESISQRVYTHSSDVWSFGVLVWEMFSFGRTPYPAQTPLEAIMSVMAGHRLPRPALCPESMYTVARACWAFNPLHRPSFAQLLAVVKADPEAGLLQELSIGIADIDRESAGQRVKQGVAGDVHGRALSARRGSEIGQVLGVTVTLEDVQAVLAEAPVGSYVVRERPVLSNTSHGFGQAGVVVYHLHVQVEERIVTADIIDESSRSAAPQTAVAPATPPVLVLHGAQDKARFSSLAALLRHYQEHVYRDVQNGVEFTLSNVHDNDDFDEESVRGAGNGDVRVITNHYDEFDRLNVRVGGHMEDAADGELEGNLGRAAETDDYIVLRDDQCAEGEGEGEGESEGRAARDEVGEVIIMPPGFVEGPVGFLGYTDLEGAPACDNSITPGPVFSAGESIDISDDN